MYQGGYEVYSQDIFGEVDEGDLPLFNLLTEDPELGMNPSVDGFQLVDSDGSISNVLNNTDLLNASRLVLCTENYGTETKPELINHAVDAASVAGAQGAGSYIMGPMDTNEPSPPESMIPEVEGGLFESWGGDWVNFEVTPLVDSKKSLYSEPKNKVYCNTDTAVAFKIQMNFQAVENMEDLMIRSFLAFKDNGSRNTAVLRCASHRAEEKSITDPINEFRLDHILRPQNPKANITYFQNEKSKRCYILIQMKDPEPGMTFLKTTLCFTCRNSCATSGTDGKAKKDIAIMFFLFNKRTGEIMGRRHVDVRVCSAPTRDFNKEHGFTNNGAASTSRKRRFDDGAEAQLLPSPKQVNVGSGEVPLSGFQPSEQQVVAPPYVENRLIRSTVRAARQDDDGVSSSQETVFSFDESAERINLKRLLKDVKWALHLKHDDDPALADYSTHVYTSLKMTQRLCDSAKELHARKRQGEQQSETSPDGGFHDVVQD